jgi:chromatin remodeling complex protein RSC6
MVRSNKSKSVESSSSVSAVAAPVSEHKTPDVSLESKETSSKKEKKEKKEKEVKEVKDGKESTKKAKKDKSETKDISSSPSEVPSSGEEQSLSHHDTTHASTEEVNISLTEIEAPLLEQSIVFISKLQQVGVLVSSLKTEYRLLEKKWSRELKNSQKLNNRKKKRASNRAPSGFVKPTRISDELAKFLDKPTGTEMARTDVTRDINKYIRTNDLQDKSNGRKINPDLKLASLLKVDKNDELTYFNLQKYMSPHFSKNVKVENPPHLDS